MERLYNFTLDRSRSLDHWTESLGALHNRSSYLLLPIASIACHGGPINTSPAWVHLRANIEFSLSCKRLSMVPASVLHHETYEAIPGMDASAPVHFGSFNDFIAIQIS